MVNNSKICSQCKELKLCTDFFKDKSHKDGLTSQCKICKHIGNEKTRLKNREQDLKRKREYYKKHKQYFYELSREWIAQNPEQNREYKRKWKYNNRTLTNEWDRKRYQKEIKARAWADLELLEFIYIKCPIGYEVDHIIPLNNKKMSGLNIPENLQYLPIEENNIKNNKLESELKFKLNPIKWQDIILIEKVG